MYPFICLHTYLYNAKGKNCFTRLIFTHVLGNSCICACSRVCMYVCMCSVQYVNKKSDYCADIPKIKGAKSFAVSMIRKLLSPGH